MLYTEKTYRLHIYSRMVKMMNRDTNWILFKSGAHEAGE